MIHTITVIYNIEAPSWGEAMEAMLRDQTRGIVLCTIESIAEGQLAIAPSNLEDAIIALRARQSIEERDE